MLARAETIRSVLLGQLTRQLREMTGTSALAAAFAADASQITPPVLVRHLLEHVNRIRMLRALDRRTTLHLQAAFPSLAERWARYARSESVHDRYFMRDLSQLGIERERIDATAAFPATAQLVRFLEIATADHGFLPAVLYSFWTEHNSEVGSEKIIRRAGETFGTAATRGASAHRALDRQQDHVQLIDEILLRTARSRERLSVVVGLLGVITELIGRYFCELEQWAEARSPRYYVAATSARA
jgi:hypothetical protein